MGVVIDLVIDLIIFWAFHIKGLTVAATIILNFLIPYFPVMFLMWSRPSVEQLTPAIVDLVTTYVVNLVNYVVSALFGYIISVPVYLALGKRAPEPEF